MDLREMKRRIGQRLIVGFEGTRVPSDLARLDDEWGLGGFILFKRNLVEFEQLMELNDQLIGMRGSIPHFIGVDQEGGSVHRMPEPFTVFPDMCQIGSGASVSLAYEVGAVTSRELKACGFNLNFAPVLDVNTNPDRSVIGRRAISEDVERVCTLGRALIRGLHDNAVVACGKHFPGHGDTVEDSHHTMPVSHQDRERLRRVETLPYQTVFRKAPHLDLIMTAHVKYPALDPKHPATLSRVILQEFLRQELAYTGLVVTDDLEMGAITDNYSMEEAALIGLEAGVDLFLVCHSRDRQVAVLEALLKEMERGVYPGHLWDRGLAKIRDLKKRHFRVVRSLDRIHAREVVGNREHQRIARRLRDGK